MSIPNATRNAYSNGTIADATAANSNEDNIVSAVNAVISEVNSAAGTVANLTTRLGVALNGDGTLKALSSALNEVQGADIASATTTDIGAATGNYIIITGTTTITGLGTVQAGTRRIIKFNGALLLTYNATSLILPTAANITTAAGDTATFVSLGSGNWICTHYQRANGKALVETTPVVTQNFLQRVEATPYTTYTGITGIIPFDDTIPQNTEGTEIQTVTITPTSATSKLVIEFTGNGASASGAISGAVAIFQDTTANALTATSFVSAGSTYTVPIVIRHEMVAGTTSATTFKVRLGVASGTLNINGAGSRLFGGVQSCRLSVTEVVA